MQSSLIETLDLAALTEFAWMAARFLIVMGLLEQVAQGPLRFGGEAVSSVQRFRVGPAAVTVTATSEMQGIRRAARRAARMTVSQARAACVEAIEAGRS